jgi:peroxiredoxin
MGKTITIKLNSRVRTEDGLMKTWYGLICLLMVALALVACNASDEAESVKPKLRIVGEFASATPTLPQPTLTPTPTPFPSQTPQPTPRRVRVTRIHDLESAALIQKGHPVPPIVLTTIDGEAFQLDQLTGQVVVINFWTLGCGSCFYEFPVFQQAHALIPPEKLLILGVNVSDLADQTRTLAETLGIQFPMVVDPQGQVFATHFGGAVVPTTVFIGADGVVFDVVVGPIDMYNLSIRLAALGLAIDIPTDTAPQIGGLHVRVNTAPPLQSIDG